MSQIHPADEPTPEAVVRDGDHPPPSSPPTAVRGDEAGDFAAGSLLPEAEQVARREAAIDLEGLQQICQTPITLAVSPPAREAGRDEHLDEIAEDMLHLLQQVKSFELGLQALSQRLDAMDRNLTGLTHAQARELNALRAELLGERRALAAMQAFEAVISPLEQLRRMRAGLNLKKDKRTIEQLDAIIHILERLLRTLGFERFEAQVRELFDPERMTCCGYAAGEPGIVLKAVKPGYRADRHIVRPAEVLIAAPSESSQS